MGTGLRLTALVVGFLKVQLRAQGYAAVVLACVLGTLVRPVTADV